MTIGGDKGQYLFGIPFVDLPKFAQVPEVGTEVVEHRGDIDHEALDDVMDFIRKHPQTWRQESWFKTVDRETGEAEYYVQVEDVELVNSCGASFCFAGHAAIRAGFPAPKIGNNEWTRKVIDESGFQWDEEVSDFAENILGLDHGQAEALFHQDNTIEDLEVIVKVLHIHPAIPGYELDEVRWREDKSTTAEEFLAWLDEN